MMSIDEAERVLDEACEALPPALFEGLNGGVSLLPDVREAEDGRLIMGLYHRDMMGQWIEIFYGSLCRSYGPEGDARLREELVRVLKHELTHHIEGRALVRDLEREDARQTEEYRSAQESAAFAGGWKPAAEPRLRRRQTLQRPWEDEK